MTVVRKEPHPCRRTKVDRDCITRIARTLPCLQVAASSRAKIVKAIIECAFGPPASFPVCVFGELGQDLADCAADFLARYSSECTPTREIPVSEFCNDGDPCTDDLCVEKAGTYIKWLQCESTPKQCDNPDDHCDLSYCDPSSGSCVPATRECPSPNLCTEGRCLPDSGECELTETDCGSKVPCYHGHCDLDSGECVFEPFECDTDGTPCVQSYCDPTINECVLAEISCDSEDPCFEGWCDPDIDACVYEERMCPPMGPCEFGYCDSESGECVFAPLLVCGDECCALSDVCTPDGCCTPQCAEKECGDDTCGGVCGSCPSTEECSPSGACEACVPDCTNKSCGDPDDCGGLCEGEGCWAHQECAGGECVTLSHHKSDCITTHQTNSNIGTLSGCGLYSSGWALIDSYCDNMCKTANNNGQRLCKLGSPQYCNVACYQECMSCCTTACEGLSPDVCPYLP